MPATAGVFENQSCSLQAFGSHHQITSDGITLITLEHHGSCAHAQRLHGAYRRAGMSAVHDRTEDCAVLVFDENERVLLLSRDAIGIHPLYYQRVGAKFAFASRVIDVIGVCGTPRLARAVVAQSLLHGRPPEPGTTYFDAVHSVPPGATLVVRADLSTLLLRSAAGPEINQNIEFESAASHFAQLFEHAVASRLDADRQSAVMVSGGLDSSAILSCTNPKQAFGVNYAITDGSQADETRYVDALRTHGYCIERVDFFPITTVAAIERNVRALEQPFADDVPATLERAASAARMRGARVVLLGTWADQILAPFPPPHIQRVAPWRLVQLIHAANSFQRFATDVSRNEVMRAFLRASLRKHVPQGLRRGLRARRRLKNVFDVLAQDAVERDHTLPPASYAEAVHNAVSDAEHIAAVEGTVKWGLANDLEVRLPFLDVALVDWLRTLPDHMAYRDSELKPLLRAAMRDRVLAEILQRRDKGDYTAPIAAGMLQAREAMNHLDELRRLVDFGLMSPASARKTLAQLSGETNIAGNMHLASNLLAVDVWLREFFEAR